LKNTAIFLIKNWGEIFCQITSGAIMFFLDNKEIAGALFYKKDKVVASFRELELLNRY
jgi:hypothetical protein